MSLDDFSYLWNGSKAGWELYHYDQTTWEITFLFDSDGPTVKEVSALRTLLDDFRDRPTTVVLQTLRGRSSYTLAKTLSNLERQWLMKKVSSTNLRMSSQPIDNSHYLPVHTNASALIIEDDRIAEAVIQKMLQAGVKVTEIHVD